MRDGRLIGASPIRELTHQAMVQMMVGREVKQRAEKGAEHPWRGSPSTVENVSLKHFDRPGDFLLRRRQPPGSLVER